jgi:DNA-binding transcriptional LysR family regulator
VRTRLTVNSADAAIASARDGHGVTCALSHQVDAALREGSLVRLLAAFEPPAMHVHVVHQAAQLPAAKARAFVDHAVPALKDALARRR